jgi:hypothetical protein
MARWLPPTLCASSDTSCDGETPTKHRRSRPVRQRPKGSSNTTAQGCVPKNASPDALHADHVYPLTKDELHQNDTVEGWIDAMNRLRMVVCVTAEENYRLETCERNGLTGPDKYAPTGITFTTPKLPWELDARQPTKTARR